MSMPTSTAFACFPSSATPHHRKNSQTLAKATNSKPFSSNSWWTPLFGISSDPDYIIDKETEEEDREMSRPRSKFSGCFTEEKAKELRKKMNETCNFHDIMYHSAIASRLAFDVTRHQDM